MTMQTVTAVRFDKVMGSGRTRPCQVACETEAGDEIEVVVKLTGQPALSPGGLLAEAVAALLANDLDIPVPTPCVVQIHEEFVRSVPDQNLRPIFEKSVGPNFGSEKWLPGHAIWIEGKAIPRKMQSVAMDVLAFDGLIQNPDRRYDNPNCVFLGDRLLLYDHELAFSHFHDLFGIKPWEPNGMKCLARHVFLQGLRGTDLNLNRFREALCAIDERRIDGYIACVPLNWHGPTVSGKKVKAYMLEAVQSFDRMYMQLQGILR